MNVQADGRMDLQMNKPLSYQDDLFRDGDSFEGTFYSGVKPGLSMKDIHLTPEG